MDSDIWTWVGIILIAGGAMAGAQGLAGLVREWLAGGEHDGA